MSDCTTPCTPETIEVEYIVDSHGNEAYKGSCRCGKYAGFTSSAHLIAPLQNRLSRYCSQGK